MSEKILIVTPPDDCLLDGIRILLFNLTDEQSAIVSTALMTADVPFSLINYIWKSGNDKRWLFDKAAKADLIIFSTDDLQQEDLIIGYFAAKPNSYYFGHLRDLHYVNDRAIYSCEDLKILLEKIG